MAVSKPGRSDSDLVPIVKLFPSFWAKASRVSGVGQKELEVSRLSIRGLTESTWRWSFFLARLRCDEVLNLTIVSFLKKGERRCLGA